MKHIVLSIVVGISLLLVACGQKDAVKKQEHEKKKEPHYTDFIARKKPQLVIEHPTASSDISNGYGAWDTKVNGKKVGKNSAIKRLPKKFQVSPEDGPHVN